MAVVEIEIVRVAIGVVSGGVDNGVVVAHGELLRV